MPPNPWPSVFLEVSQQALSIGKLVTVYGYAGRLAPIAPSVKD
jgi:hypothetical protein